MKICRECKVAKSFECYYKAKGNADGFMNTCKPCYIDKGKTPERKAYLRKYLEEHSIEIKSYKQEWAYLKRYNLSAKDYHEMLMAQCGMCSVCDRLPIEVWETAKMQKLYVHHNHDTGKVIGLVCYSCNIGMGHFNDSPELLRRAASLNE